MVDALSLRKEDRILEIGTGLGYQAAVLSYLCHEVYTIEQFADLVIEARRNLERAKISNVKAFLGDGSLGLPDHAPFDAIILAAAAPKIPLPLQEQLAEGGRLVQPIGLGGNERVNVYWKNEGKLEFRKRVTLARFVKLRALSEFTLKSTLRSKIGEFTG
jgi:protein-L-isoaspartate(D-aspartate) O-methyltransferase